MLNTLTKCFLANTIFGYNAFCDGVMLARKRLCGKLRANATINLLKTVYFGFYI